MLYKLITLIWYLFDEIALQTEGRGLYDVTPKIIDWVDKWVASGRGDKDELLDVASALEDELGAKRGNEL